MTLTEKEYNLLDKIATKSKMDCWFCIQQTEDGQDYVYDLEERKCMPLNTAIFQLMDGIEGLYDEYFENEEEYETMIMLLLKLI